MAIFTRPNETHTRGLRTRSRVALIALASVLALAALSATACSSAAPSASQSTSQAESQTTASSTTSADAGSASTAPAPAEAPAADAKLIIKDTKVGKGRAAKAGDTVTVDYTGWLMDGTKFDSSIGRAPFTFPLGAGQVIQGWDEGVVGMKAGGTRILTIPPQLGYGEQGSPPAIPANATLKFEVKVISIQPGQ